MVVVRVSARAARWLARETDEYAHEELGYAAPEAHPPYAADLVELQQKFAPHRNTETDVEITLSPGAAGSLGAHYDTLADHRGDLGLLRFASALLRAALHGGEVRLPDEAAPAQ
ncbi:hypothetical protein SAMN02982929_05323 [Saccharopolyspora kobensis]|uniref:Uncharacterized protein n=1 Tax=Saccharopolyspora kobensis TaxID=146035 RepID=A0A1H6E0E7_9PSEU|nr:hypothetical protein [Saccharopolyspora kobensis]SEG90839.1 hypothetical protein SAMN02982929_05323 [Saccharopolyspora kobensis]SFD94175.1 hypothetical protein SAMN05216506_107299 [Saccharopolyspora kobensis]